MTDRLQIIRDKLHELIYNREVSCFSEYERTLQETLAYMDNMLDRETPPTHLRRYQVTGSIHGMFNGTTPEEAKEELNKFLKTKNVHLPLTNVYAIETTTSLMRRHPDLVDKMESPSITINGEKKPS